MLHLKSSVHFHEVELIGNGIKDEFNSSSIDVANSFGSLDSGLTDLLSNLLADLRRCFLDDFLVTSLHRAVTLIQVHIIAVFITEHLQLNVTRFLDVLLNNDMFITETFEGLTFGSIQLIEEFFFVSHNTHSLATASERGLDDDGEADLFGLAEQELRILFFSVVSRHNGDLRITHDKLRFTL